MFQNNKYIIYVYIYILFILNIFIYYIYIYTWGMGNWSKCVFSMFKKCSDFFVSAPAKPQAPLEVVLES